MPSENRGRNFHKAPVDAHLDDTAVDVELASVSRHVRTGSREASKFSFGPPNPDTKETPSSPGRLLLAGPAMRGSPPALGSDVGEGAALVGEGGSPKLQTQLPELPFGSRTLQNAQKTLGLSRPQNRGATRSGEGVQAPPCMMPLFSTFRSVMWHVSSWDCSGLVAQSMSQVGFRLWGLVGTSLTPRK